MTLRLTCSILAALATAVPIAAWAQACGCGPTYCTDTPEYKKALESKKKSLAGHPQRLIALFDRVDRCEASITTSPDGFSLFRQDKDGNITVDTWMSENEKIGAQAIESGSLRTCRVIITRRAFACCGATPYDKRADFVASLDLNTTATTVCSK